MRLAGTVAVFACAACASGAEGLDPLTRDGGGGADVAIADTGPALDAGARADGSVSTDASYLALYRSGTRLRAHVLEAAEAPSTPIFLGFEDLELDAPCEVAIASDGRPRCLPFSPREVSGEGEYFADENCAQPIAAV